MNPIEVSTQQAMAHYPLYINPLVHGRYLARYELFKRVLNVEGNILECGVAWGGGLMMWSQLSWLLEPYAMTRKIYGFDTFTPEAPFPEQREQDGVIPEDIFSSNQDHLQNVLDLFASSCGWGIQKTFLVAGNACETIPQWCTEKPHALVALLYLDFDVYAPTKTALEYFLPRMPRGAIIAFDECNYGKWPGETIAFLEVLGCRSVHLQRFPWHQTMAFCEL